MVERHLSFSLSLPDPADCYLFGDSNRLKQVSTWLVVEAKILQCY